MPVLRSIGMKPRTSDGRPSSLSGSFRPVIWGNRIFLTGTIAGEIHCPFPSNLQGRTKVDPEQALRFMVACINLKDGSLVWEKPFETPNLIKAPTNPPIGPPHPL